MSAVHRADARVPSVERTLKRLFLTLFLRGRTARGLNRKSAPTSVARKLGFTLIFYALFGCIALTLFRQPVFALSVYLHAMSFVFLGMFVAASAGEILFNREEADILLHRPISARALLWAKIGVLVQVSLWLTGAFNIGGFVVGAISHGWLYPAAHTLSTFLEALFCTGCVVLTYQLCLRWLGRERLERLMTTTQVLVSVAFILAAQILPRVLFKFGNVLDLKASTWWTLLLPPAWFAGLDDAIAGSRTPASWLLGGMAVLATAILLWAAFGKLSRDYIAGLQTLNEAGGTGAIAKRRARRWAPLLLDAPPLSWWLRDPAERAAFLLSAAYIFRDRDMKLRLYPGIVPMLVVPIILLMQPGETEFSIAFAGTFLGILPMLALQLLSYSQQWQAADLFHIVPVPGPTPLCRGARRAVLCLLVIPMLTMLVLIVWLLGAGGVGRLALLLPGLIALPIYTLIPCLDGSAVPLSRATEESRTAGRGLAMLIMVFASAVLAGIALWARSSGWFWNMVLVEALLVAGLHYLLQRRVSKLAWTSLE